MSNQTKAINIAEGVRHRIYVKTSPELKRRIMALAAREKRSMGGMTEILLEEVLQKYAGC